MTVILPVPINPTAEDLAPGRPDMSSLVQTWVTGSSGLECTSSMVSDDR